LETSAAARHQHAVLRAERHRLQKTLRAIGASIEFIATRANDSRPRAQPKVSVVVLKYLLHALPGQLVLEGDCPKLVFVESRKASARGANPKRAPSRSEERRVGKECVTQMS